MNNSTNASNLGMIPLLLFSLGVSIFLLSGNAWGYVSDGAYASFALFTGGLGSLIAGFWAYRTGNTAGNRFGFVAASALGTFFASSALYHWFFASTAPDAAMNRAWISLAWTVVFGFLALASVRVSEIPGPGKVMWFLIFVFFLFRWIGPAFHLDVALKVEAVTGIIVAIFAMIGGFITLRDAL